MKAIKKQVLRGKYRINVINENGLQKMAHNGVNTYVCQAITANNDHVIYLNMTAKQIDRTRFIMTSQF